MIAPSPLTKKLIEEAAKVARVAYNRGWTAGTAGNFSVREPDPSVAWVSPSGVTKGLLNPLRFIRVATDTAMPIAPDYRKPSDETPLHCAVYRKIEHARAVVHVHTPHLVRATLASSKPLSFKGQEMIKALGLGTHTAELTIPSFVNSQDMHKLAKDVTQAINPDVPAFVLIGHGIYTWAETPSKALAYAEGIEFLCQTKP